MGITIKKLKEILSLNKGFVISFVGSYPNGCRECAIYTYDGRFSLEGEQLVCPGIDYTRHYSKIIMIRKGDELLYGKRCRSCGKAIPKSHGNCFQCYSSNIEKVCTVPVFKIER